MNRKQLYSHIIAKQSFLCVGLDPTLDKIPPHLLDYEDPIFEFNKRIIDATKDYCVAYKPNIAFYEALGISGWESLQKTIDYIPKNIFTIADAKRGDIGNTSKKYAEAFFKIFNFDAITVTPYMGIDSVTPFLAYSDKWVIMLGLTSNQGSKDFQFLTSQAGKPLYEYVLEKGKKWGNPNNLMYVVGATHPLTFKKIRCIAEEHFLLVPGIGAQGGNLQEVCLHGLNDMCGLLVNSSRSIIYASREIDFEVHVKNQCVVLQKQMKEIIRKLD